MGAFATRLPLFSEDQKKPFCSAFCLRFCCNFVHISISPISSFQNPTVVPSFPSPSNRMDASWLRGLNSAGQGIGATACHSGREMFARNLRIEKNGNHYVHLWSFVRLFWMGFVRLNVWLMYEVGELVSKFLIRNGDFISGNWSRWSRWWSGFGTSEFKYWLKWDKTTWAN